MRGPRAPTDDRTRRGAARKPTPLASTRAAIIQETDERAENGSGGAVVIARVDPSKLLDGRSPALHKDVVEALVDLAVALLDGEGDLHAEDPSG